MKPLLKVCGITNEADAMALAQLGVAYLGYRLQPAAAQAIIQKVRRYYPKVQHVGVLVQPTTHDIQQLMPQAEFDILQIYGTVPHSPLPIWQNCTIQNLADLAKLKPANEIVIGLQCDMGLDSQQAIPVELLPKLQCELPLILSGGIGPSNLMDILEHCLVDVIDVNEQVEAAPGKKDIAKIKALLEHLEVCL